LRLCRNKIVEYHEQIKTSKRMTRLTRPLLPAEKINGWLYNIFINRKMPTYRTFLLRWRSTVFSRVCSITTLQARQNKFPPWHKTYLGQTLLL
jgi:hypothetical protein